jgi:hypothetical protein
MKKHINLKEKSGIYMIRLSENNKYIIKVGFSKNLFKRMKSHAFKNRIILAIILKKKDLEWHEFCLLDYLRAHGFERAHGREFFKFKKNIYSMLKWLYSNLYRFSKKSEEALKTYKAVC